ncbi:MAG: DMT family transporter [Rubrobacter sp.]|nr:DMT family transporter [Rubrobacter sp.]
MNPALVLAMFAGVAIAVQVVFNAIGMRSLGVGGLIGVSGLATAVVGFIVAFLSQRPEITTKALACAVVSGLLGSFILGSIVIAAEQNGLARTLSLVLAAQLLAGLAIDRAGLFGVAGQLGPAKIFGIALVLVGGILLVRD